MLFICILHCTIVTFLKVKNKKRKTLVVKITWGLLRKINLLSSYEYNLKPWAACVYREKVNSQIMTPFTFVKIQWMKWKLKIKSTFSVKKASLTNLYWKINANWEISKLYVLLGKLLNLNEWQHFIQMKFKWKMRILDQKVLNIFTRKPKNKKSHTLEFICMSNNILYTTANTFTFQSPDTKGSVDTLRLPVPPGIFHFYLHPHLPFLT